MVKETFWCSNVEMVRLSQIWVWEVRNLERWLKAHLVTVLFQPVGEICFFGLCAGLCSSTHTSLVWAIIVPHSLKKRKEKTFLYNPTGTGSVQVLTHKHQIEKLSTLSALLFLVCSCISSAGEIKPDNILEQSLHFYFTDLLLRRWVGGGENSQGVVETKRRGGGKRKQQLLC